MRPQAFAALKALVLHSGQFLTYDQFIQEAWDGTIVSRHASDLLLTHRSGRSSRAAALDKRLSSVYDRAIYAINQAIS